jgi:transposase
LKTRYQIHRDHLLVFLQRPDVAADNNARERALRPSVIHRKVMGSFRSDWGRRAYATLATVLNTAKRHGEMDNPQSNCHLAHRRLCLCQLALGV